MGLDIKTIKKPTSNGRLLVLTMTLFLKPIMSEEDNLVYKFNKFDANYEVNLSVYKKSHPQRSAPNFAK
ncbi:hypothetical protein CUU64_20745 [Bacillus sp. V5-8f]|nr:hypothetical protein CUU64_20745 [Bacillus sp. V5-8f]